MHKTPLHKHLLNIFMMATGSLVISVGVSVFYTPNQLLSGGVWGLAMLSEHFWPMLPTGFFLFLYNIPLMLLAARELDKRFVIYSVITIIFQSLIMLKLPYIMPAYDNDTLLACIFGGVLAGAGNALVIRFHGSGGGLDIVGLVMKKRLDISVGNTVLAFNTVIVGMAAFFFGLERAMYTMVGMFVNATVFNRILQGFNPKRTVMVITDHGAELSHSIITVLGHGVTILKAEGAYSRHSKDVLICIISRYEVPRTKELIAHIDPAAFTAISETGEVMGNFKDHSMTQNLLHHHSTQK